MAEPTQEYMEALVAKAIEIHDEECGCDRCPTVYIGEYLNQAAAALEV